MIEQYGEEKGNAVYYAWLNKHGYDDTKPLEGQKSKAEEKAPMLVVEKFEWVKPLRFYQANNGLIIRGEAIHAGLTRNKNLYTPEELLRAARSLIGSRLQYLNHDNWLGEGNEVLDAEYVDGKIEYVARVVDPKAVEAIKKGEITHVSIDGICRRGVALNGVKACEGLILNGLCLVHRDDPVGPGDLNSTVEIWRECCCSNRPELCKSSLETDSEGFGLKMNEKNEEKPPALVTAKEQAPEPNIEDKVKILEEQFKTFQEGFATRIGNLETQVNTILQMLQASEKAEPTPSTQETGVGIVKPVGELSRFKLEPGVIKVAEIENIIADRKLFTPMLKLRAILDLVEKRRQKSDSNR